MIQALVVDDSVVMRKLLADVLRADPMFSTVETACDPYDAWRKLKRFRPDVVTLDVEMPRMNGLTFLAKLMQADPLPVVIVSNKAVPLPRAAQAFAYAAVPRIDPQTGKLAGAAELIAKVKSAAADGAKQANPKDQAERATATRSAKATVSRCQAPPCRLVAIGASTGGTEALTELLSSLPPSAPGIVIAQHMPARFIDSFARRLDRESRLAVHVATDGELIQPGNVSLAQGERHAEVRRAGTKFYLRSFAGPAVNRFCPSVDVLFNSVARHAGDQAVGVLLTGMGCDGAAGLLAMRQAGISTIAQDEHSSVVFGMPKEAIAAGAAEQVLPLGKIGPAIMRAAEQSVCT